MSQYQPETPLLTLETLIPTQETPVLTLNHPRSCPWQQPVSCVWQPGDHHGPITLLEPTEGNCGGHQGTFRLLEKDFLLILWRSG